MTHERAGGDPATFEKYRGLLFSIAYRMTGSVTDAEDLLQESLLRWLQTPSEGVYAPRAFLVTTISRLCINHLQSARVQREAYVGQWLPEPIVTDPMSDPLHVVTVDETISMAFLVLLERLTAVERAVLLLRDVFGYKHSEISKIVGESEANCRQLLRRARGHLAEARRRFEAPLKERSDLLESFIRAARVGDMEGLLAVLAHNVVLQADGGGKALAAPNRIVGAENVTRAAIGFRKFLPDELEIHLAQINGNPGFITYVDGKPYNVFTVDVADSRICAIYIVTNPDKLSRLPPLQRAGSAAPQ